MSVSVHSPRLAVRVVDDAVVVRGLVGLVVAGLPGWAVIGGQN
jgi:hypothetical protein